MLHSENGGVEQKKVSESDISVKDKLLATFSQSKLMEGELQLANCPKHLPGAAVDTLLEDCNILPDSSNFDDLTSYSPSNNGEEDVSSGGQACENLPELDFSNFDDLSTRSSTYYGSNNATDGGPAIDYETDRSNFDNLTSSSSRRIENEGADNGEPACENLSEQDFSNYDSNDTTNGVPAIDDGKHSSNNDNLTSSRSRRKENEDAASGGPASENTVDISSEYISSCPSSQVGEFSESDLSGLDDTSVQATLGSSLDDLNESASLLSERISSPEKQQKSTQTNPEDLFAGSEAGQKMLTHAEVIKILQTCKGMCASEAHSSKTHTLISTSETNELRNYHSPEGCLSSINVLSESLYERQDFGHLATSPPQCLNHALVALLPNQPNEESRNEFRSPHLKTQVDFSNHLSKSTPMASSINCEDLVKYPWLHPNTTFSSLDDSDIFPVSKSDRAMRKPLKKAFTPFSDDESSVDDGDDQVENNGEEEVQTFKKPNEKSQKPALSKKKNLVKTRGGKRTCFYTGPRGSSPKSQDVRFPTKLVGQTNVPSKDSLLKLSKVAKDNRLVAEAMNRFQLNQATAAKEKDMSKLITVPARKECQLEISSTSSSEH